MYTDDSNTTSRSTARQAAAELGGISVTVQDDLETVQWDVDEDPHITVDNSVCESCEDKPCLHLCPAECFDYQEDREGGIYFAYEPCIECGACMIFCQNDPDKGAVSWSKPSGGKGVEFDLG